MIGEHYGSTVTGTKPAKITFSAHLLKHTLAGKPAETLTGGGAELQRALEAMNGQLFKAAIVLQRVVAEAEARARRLEALVATRQEQAVATEPLEVDEPIIAGTPADNGVLVIKGGEGSEVVVELRDMSLQGDAPVLPTPSANGGQSKADNNDKTRQVMETIPGVAIGGETGKTLLPEYKTQNPELSHTYAAAERIILFLLDTENHTFASENNNAGGEMRIKISEILKIRESDWNNGLSLLKRRRIITAKKGDNQKRTKSFTLNLEMITGDINLECISSRVKEKLQKLNEKTTQLTTNVEQEAEEVVTESEKGSKLAQDEERADVVKEPEYKIPNDALVPQHATAERIILFLLDIEGNVYTSETDNARLEMKAIIGENSEVSSSDWSNAIFLLKRHKILQPKKLPGKRGVRSYALDLEILERIDLLFVSERVKRKLGLERLPNHSTKETIVEPKPDPAKETVSIDEELVEEAADEEIDDEKELDDDGDDSEDDENSAPIARKRGTKPNAYGRNSGYFTIAFRLNGRRFDKKFKYKEYPELGLDYRILTSLGFMASMNQAPEHAKLQLFNLVNKGNPSIASMDKELKEKEIIKLLKEVDRLIQEGYAINVEDKYELTKKAEEIIFF